MTVGPFESWAEVGGSGLPDNAGDLLRPIDDVDLPVVKVWGDEDRLLGSPAVDHLVERRPDGDLEVLPSIGHAPVLEAPEEYPSTVTTWVEASSGAPA